MSATTPGPGAPEETPAGDPAAPLADPRAVTRGVRATYVAFVGAGFAFASWASRIPQVRDRLHLSAAHLGLLLLAISFGSIVALILSGAIVHRFGSRRTVAITSLVVAAGLAAAAVAYRAGAAPLVAVLVVFGFAYGAWDVAMNVHGATVERLHGRSIMPRFHAGYSIGTVGGALVGAAMEALHVPVTAHLIGIAAVLAVAVPVSTRRFVDDDEPEPPARPVTAPDGQASRTGAAFARWREPRTVLIGVFVLAFSFAEGAANDWLGVSFIDGHHVGATTGTLGFATFLAAMTLSRWFGPATLDRFGRTPVIRVLGAVGVGGLLLYVLSGPVWLAFAGTVLWGIGCSLGFPVGMSAAADQPAAAAARVSVVASIGYFAFLGGPPLIGFVGQHSSVLHALVVAAGLLAVATALAGVLRPLPAGTDPSATSAAGARPTTGNPVDAADRIVP